MASKKIAASLTLLAMTGYAEFLSKRHGPVIASAAKQSKSSGEGKIAASLMLLAMTKA